MSFFRKSSGPPGVFPTYLVPSLPFRRKSRQYSSDSNSSVLSTGTVSSVGSNPFSRCPTPVPLPINTNPIQAPSDKFLSGHDSHIHCAKCSTDLCLTSQIISKGFTGRHGRAYLVQGRLASPSMHISAAELPNTFLSKPAQRNLVTGQHMVSDLSCAICGSLLGWKYVQASEEGQKYKVGKFILETKRIRVGVRWDNDDDHDGMGGHGGGDGGDGYDETLPLPPTEMKAGEGLEFDSQDEDECEDLFAGVWSPQLASRRRQRKSERYRRRAAKVYVPTSRGSQESLS